MEIDNRKILVAIGLVTLLLFPLVAFSTGTLRIAVGLVFVLFFPGYVLLSALFPRRGDLGGTERVALSFGLSIAVVPLIGLILNYTPWGIKLYPILISVTVFVFITSAIAYYRLQKLSTSDRFSVAFRFNFPRWAGMPRLDKALFVSLIIAILAAVGFLGYVVTTPKEGEKFTEFYILNMEGKAENYPQQIVLGDTVDIIIGVVNHEYQPTSYSVAVMTDGNVNAWIDASTMAHGEKWEKVVSFTPQHSGKRQNVEFLLYKDRNAEPYFGEPLHLYVDVIAPQFRSQD